MVGKSVACLELKIDTPFRRIIVNEILPDRIEEKEVILPRETQLRITEKKECKGINDIQAFLDHANVGVRAEWLIDTGIDSIIHCKVSINETIE